jgi:hypothetical protein
MALYPKLPQDAGGIPVGGLWLPNGAWYALQATTATTTDSNSRASAGLAVGWFASNVYAHASSPVTSNGNSGDLAVDSFSELAVDINITAISGTSPTIQFIVERKGNDSNYYAIYTGTSLNTNQALSISLGAGMGQSVSFGSVARLRWVLGGTSPSFTFSASIIGKS